MTLCFAYIRVSTVKQGEHGVSLQEQRAAIERYVARHQLEVTEWFEERLTAAKKGRPLFTRMLKRLRAGDAAGVVIHKIDRSARNLRDWAELAELIDAGVSVHFANESVDLNSRGGRLSADIQAVVAADYVRNLREETLKGIYGRLKQGLFPFGAPIGYLDSGGGKVKRIDPVRAPLVRDAYELYASGRFTLDTLLIELSRRGLLTRRGRALSRRGVADILHNPFYTGLIQLRLTGEVFKGKHESIVSTLLFQQVQARLQGRVRVTKWVHDFTLRGLFRCSLCHRILTGETRKGHIYYRCHTSTCPTKGFREEVLEAAMLEAWPAIAITESEMTRLRTILEWVESRDVEDDTRRRDDLRLQLAAVRDRTRRLVDAFIDGHLDKALFESRKRDLLVEERRLEESARSPIEPSRPTEMLVEMFGLASRAQQSYKMGTPASKRELAIRLCSDRSVAGNDVVVKPHPTLLRIADRRAVHCGDPHRTVVRTSVKDVWRMYAWGKRWVKRYEKDEPGA